MRCDTAGADEFIVLGRCLASTLRSSRLAPEKPAAIHHAVESDCVALAKIPLAVRNAIVTVSRLTAIKQFERIIETVINLENTGAVDRHPENGLLIAPRKFCVLREVLMRRMSSP